jgi:hypothetical protein
MSAAKKKIRVKLSGKQADTAYLMFEGHELEPGIVKKTVWISELIPDCKGPHFLLNFDKTGRVIGLEILA